MPVRIDLRPMNILSQIYEKKIAPLEIQQAILRDVRMAFTGGLHIVIVQKNKKMTFLSPSDHDSTLFSCLMLLVDE